MIKHKKLLIDQDCPMCQAYGSAFTKYRLIDSATVTPYQTAHPNFTAAIDMDRAKNEIALYCTKTNKTKYGIDAMIEIVSQPKGIFRKILSIKPVHSGLIVLYRFVSFNRKVIAPAATIPNLRSCTPSVNLLYNWSFILFCALITGYILNHFALQINRTFAMNHDPWPIYLICFGQIIWQSVAVLMVNRKKYLAYLGNMSTVSLSGGLLLAPALIIFHILNLPIAYLLIAFTMVIGLMLIEHIRRCRLIGLPFFVSISWILYRVAVLTVLIYLNLPL